MISCDVPQVSLLVQLASYEADDPRLCPLLSSVPASKAREVAPSWVASTTSGSI